MKQHTLHKSERLKSRKTISRLFANEGKSLVSYPFKVVWLQIQVPDAPDYPAQVAVSVPSRNFPKATDRNLLKRRIKEAYRLQKSVLYNHITPTPLNEPSTLLAIMFIYLGKEKIPYEVITQKVSVCLMQLVKRISVTPTKVDFE